MIFTSTSVSHISNYNITSMVKKVNDFYNEKL